jgi:hypothetical protein
VARQDHGVTHPWNGLISVRLPSSISCGGFPILHGMKLIEEKIFKDTILNEDCAFRPGTFIITSIGSPEMGHCCIVYNVIKGEAIDSPSIPL